MRKALTVLTSLILAAPGAAIPLRLEADYRVTFLRLPLIDLSVTAALEAEAYEAEGVYRTIGLGRWVKRAVITANATGVRDDHGRLVPRRYDHANLDGRKNRRTLITRSADAVTVTADPPLGSLGEPPATPAQKREAVDTLTAIVSFFLHHPSTPCAPGAKIFDGKQRYDMVLRDLGPDAVKTRAYDGPARKCEMTYVPIAGFDADDIPETPIVVEMWMATVAPGVIAPVKFRGRLSFGSAVIRASRIVADGPPLGLVGQK
ncbi:MAG: DUF3108 domain-containing protein [Maricaulaceae bacterium]